MFYTKNVILNSKNENFQTPSLYWLGEKRQRKKRINGRSNEKENVNKCKKQRKKVNIRVTPSQVNSAQLLYYMFSIEIGFHRFPNAL